MNKPIITIIEDKKTISQNDYYIISAVFGFVLGILLYTFFTPNYFEGDKVKEIDIQNGASFVKVVDILYDQKIIPNKLNMKIAGFLYGAERKIKAGRYKIPNGLSYLQLTSILTKGAAEPQILVTIPEGIWQHNLAKLLKEELNIDSTEFMNLSSNKIFLQRHDITEKSIEGYLLPETYYFFENMTPEEIILKLKSEMDNLFDEKIERRMKELNMTKHEILTLASIIEGESNIVSEFKTISGVYHNRLKKGIKLQADPTVQYLKRHKRRYNKIYYKDLEIDSPFNTYKYPGLPPAPINNPGKEAIIAALYPEEHEYYYFVASGNGDHVFSKTLREHNKNVRQYRLWRKYQN
ncbi:MAG: endolytic transglycosylase MltG [Ignavibacteria bacterium]|jgi:UPF0755 protein